MLKRVLSLALAGIVWHALFLEQNFASSKALEAARISDLKGTIAKLGMAKETRVEIRLKDKKKLAVYIREVGDESFEVTDLKTGASITVPYANVAQVRGRHFSNRADTIIYTAIAIGIIVLAGIFGHGD